MRNALVLHTGARLVSLEEVAAVPVPNPTATWFPIAHNAVLETVEETLRGTAFAVREQRLALSSNSNQFFATLDLAAPLAEGVSLTIGIRNSIDKTLPLGFLAGHRVFVCDNLSFSAELMVNRKHTVNGGARFAEAIALAVGRLDAFQKAEAGRIDRLKELEIDNPSAESLILQAWEGKIVNHLQLPHVIQEWRHPSHEEFAPRTRWALFNAFTEVLKPLAERNPQSFAGRTFNLNRLLVPPNEGPADIQQIAAELGALNAAHQTEEETV